MPSDWLTLTTHRLDIYKEEWAKTEFLERLESLFQSNVASEKELSQLPTAYDYIRLGHPLSSVLEWGLAKVNHLPADSVISFSSKTTPLLAILRKNLFLKKATQIVFLGEIPSYFDAATIRSVYGYNFEVKSVTRIEEIPAFDGTTALVTAETKLGEISIPNSVDFLVTVLGDLGSIVLVNGEENRAYIAEIQHVRRRETIAMTPANCLSALQLLLNQPAEVATPMNAVKQAAVVKEIQHITGTQSNALVASSGLSMQYAIMMGLVDDALVKHPQKAIKIVVPPNCYGGTNDQARRVAACRPDVDVMDLPVDGDNDMVQSIELVLNQVAKDDAVPYIIAEIPTNPRVEVPNLDELKAVLSKERKTPTGSVAIAPVFILDQTFCPNVQFLSPTGVLSAVKTIAYVSGSKFPSGGKCTAGYCVANEQAEYLMPAIKKHLQLCDNAATPLQIEILAEQMPSMLQRIADAYVNTRDFVNFIHETLPAAKINFVSEELAEQGFTPSVFSLDLPTKGNTPEEHEAHKRALNQKLIDSMIGQIPNESKYCVSYGQLKGCYWTIPATSTQGTTKEADKDYIARVSVSGNLDLALHKQVFQQFVEEM